MRILAIRGANIASLTSFDVDFRKEPLRSAGIFAITGPTGAGKSSILDAMCLALFQEAPRLEGVSAQEGKLDSAFGTIAQSDIRNLLQRGTSTGFAQCEFLGQDGHEYRAHWGFRAPKRAGASVQEELSLVRLDDALVMIHGNRKHDFQAKVVELLGLTYQQFTRTVLLAQGRFSEFLRSRSNERAELLEKLTGTEIYARISTAVFERSSQQKEEFRRLQSELDALQLLPEQEREILSQELKEASAHASRLQFDFDKFRHLQSSLAKHAGERREKISLESSVLGLESELAGTEGLLEACKLELDDAKTYDAQLQPQLIKATDLDQSLAVTGSRRLDRQSQAQLDQQTLDRVSRDLEENRSRETEVARQIEGLESELKKNERLAPVSLEWSRWRENLQAVLRLSQRQDVQSGMQALATLDFQSLERTILANADKCNRLTAVLGDLTLAELNCRRESLTSMRQDLSELSKLREQERGLAKSRQDLDLTEEELSILERTIPSLEASLSTARSMWESVRLAFTESIEDLRAHLVDEHPCPVCGSIEHPWTKEDPTLRRLATAQESQVIELQKDCDTARGRFVFLQASKERLELECSEIARRILAIQVSPELRARTEGVVDIDVWLISQQERFTQEHATASALLEPAEQLETLRRTMPLDELRKSQIEMDLRRIALDLEGLAIEQETRSALVDTALGSPAWREFLKTQKDAYLQNMDGRIERFLKTQQEVQEQQETLRLISDRIKGLSEQQIAVQMAYEQSRVLLQDAELELESLQSSRSNLLGGRSVTDVRTQSQTSIQAAQEALESVTENRKVQIERRMQLQGQLEATMRQIQLVAQELQAIGEQLLPSCQDVFALTPEEISDFGTTLETSLGSARTRSIEIGATLERDDRNCQKGKELQSHATAAQELFRNWGALNDAIGSRDGKAFRTIAQQFTLDALLKEANRELQGITRRYSLKSLSDSMNFGVLDHDAFDELRPVQTLSGGESFLVSLSLALGLSRLAGGALSVESLFIDEGFGTLDPDTLRSVMNALSQLHAQGRKVGLITHVEEMKELIPVRLEVIPTGQGASRILMPT
jgi:DNA repair protein SbcC/Rad50